MTRDAAIARIEEYFDTDGYFDDLARRVAIPTESQDPDRRPELVRYLDGEMTATFERLGFTGEVFDNPVDGAGPPFLVARRHEGDDLLTVFGYGHGDVVRGYDDEWNEGLSPWRLQKEGDLWYGRGTADNKGQHSINLAALEAVLAERGSLGFNVVFLIETGEETGSPGLREFCAAHQGLLAADVLLASDGPRLAPDRPTLFMGTRGAVNFDLTVDLREGGHHSGNWGGLLANPGMILAHALASITTATGELLVPELRPAGIPDSVRAAIHDLDVGGGDNAPKIDPEWGEPGFTAAEKVYGWNTFEVLAFTTGNPEKPANAVPPRAQAHCQIRFVVPSDPDEMVDGLRRHLDQAGFTQVELTRGNVAMMATRLDPDHPWAQWAASSIERTSGQAPAVLPNLGGSLPNDVFADLLGLPTLWVPHSYSGCSQHAPNEHLLDWIARDALRIMTGLYWDLGEVESAPGI
ncbi:MAG: M20 family metallopeptidase [Actinomycetia bacterium]|nr:M20 family metallopeptidase [Actinomycetes bacterium]